MLQALDHVGKAIDTQNIRLNRSLLHLFLGHIPSGLHLRTLSSSAPLAHEQYPTAHT